MIKQTEHTFFLESYEVAEAIKNYILGQEQHILELTYMEYRVLDKHGNELKDVEIIFTDAKNPEGF